MMKKYCLVGEISDFDYHDAFWDFCGPKSLKAFLADLKAGEKAVIEVNSPGGLVMAGIEMANAIKNSNAHIIAHVTGIAASMASVVVCACDEIHMEEASFMMVHNPWTVSQGDADQLRKDAAFLDQCKSVIMSFYRGKFSCDETRLSEMMAEETWYTGMECKENGLACEVIASETRAAARVGERQFKNMPDGAKDLYSFREMDEATREQIRASVLSEPTEAETHEAATEEPETVSAETADGSGDGSSAPATPTTSEGGEGVSPSAAADWEARFKGASRKINELQESIRSKDSKIQDLESQLVALTKDLAASSDKVSALSATLEEGAKALEAKDRELAEVRDSLAKANEHAKHLEETRNLLTGGVLCVSESDSEYEAKMAKAKSAKEREHLRALKRAGKIN